MPIPVIELIDTHQFGLPRTGAVYLIRGPSPVLIESGTAASATAICDAFSELAKFGELAKFRNLSPEYIFLTHIHLDHAGGAGHLAKAYPQAKIVVHERGRGHLVDPSRLIKAVRSASPDLFPLYGSPLPISEQRLLPVVGGEVLDLGKNIRLEVIAAPGHAPHHICILERNSRTLFTGDAVGNWNDLVDVPLTVPPRFDLAKALATLKALKRLRPKRLAFTHFGIADQALAQLDRYERQLIDWFEYLRKLSTLLLPAEIVTQVLDQAKYASLPEIKRSMVAMCVRGALLSLEAGTA